MNEYLKQYIELQKQFRETEGDPDSVRALYTFKEKLELSEDKQAKEVLVDVYDLLDFKKDAYELLCQIGNRSDKKTLKRLGTLKDYAENWGNHYALPKPKTPEEKQNEKDRQAQLGLIPLLPLLRHLGPLRPQPLQVLLRQLQRRDVRFREVAVVLGVLLGAHGEGGILVLIPAPGLLYHALSLLNQLDLPPGLILDGPGDRLEGAEIFHLGAGTEVPAPGRPHR